RASRKSASSVQGTVSSASKASRISEVPTASPSPRNSSQKATTRGARPGGGASACGFDIQPRPAELDPDPLGDQVHVGAVLDDDAHRLLEHRGVQVVGAEQQER